MSAQPGSEAWTRRGHTLRRAKGARDGNAGHAEGEPTEDPRPAERPHESGSRWRKGRRHSTEPKNTTKIRKKKASPKQPNTQKSRPNPEKSRSNPEKSHPKKQKSSTQAAQQPPPTKPAANTPYMLNFRYRHDKTSTRRRGQHSGRRRTRRAPATDPDKRLSGGRGAATLAAKAPLWEAANRQKETGILLRRFVRRGGRNLAASHKSAVGFIKYYKTRTQV